MYTQYFTNVKQTNAGHKYMGNPTKHADTWKPHNMQTQGNPTTGRHMETPQDRHKETPGKARPSNRKGRVGWEVGVGVGVWGLRKSHVYE